jgi:catechol 2,3-dioxygenase-like lactoylglutathione lyase family enzyme
VQFRKVRLHAPEQSLGTLTAFYADSLGLPGPIVGETTLEFAAGEGEPFYHFALLAPGDRFPEMLAWAGERVELLPDSDSYSGEVVFDFSNWDAQACYFHDPAGNIVELIAHRGIGEAGTKGPFAGRELLGVSELGLVGDTTAMARLLRDDLGLELWDGSLDEGRLAFLGERARTLILGPAGRGWLPTERPAELHPVEAELSGLAAGSVELEGGLYRLSGVGD